MRSVSTARPRTPKVHPPAPAPASADVGDGGTATPRLHEAIDLAHRLAAPILQSLAALYDLGRRGAELEDADLTDPQTMADATSLVATARKVADLCAIAARGCTVGTDPTPVRDAMRFVIESITRIDDLSVRTDGDEAWALVPVDDAR